MGDQDRVGRVVQLAEKEHVEVAVCEPEAVARADSEKVWVCVWEGVKLGVRVAVWEALLVPEAEGEAEALWKQLVVWLGEWVGVLEAVADRVAVRLVVPVHVAVRVLELAVGVGPVAHRHSGWVHWDGGGGTKPRRGRRPATTQLRKDGPILPKCLI